MTSRNLARKAAALALSKKATDVTVMDLRALTSITDFFVICSADSDTQIRAIADAIVEGLEKKGERIWHREGASEATWLLLDYVNVVIHVFRRDTRSFYNLERLWGDAKFEYIEDKPAATPARRKARLLKKVVPP